MFGDILRELRLDAGLKQEELAEKFNISATAISKYEAGEREPTYDFLISVSDFFNVSTDYILGRTRIPTQYKDLHALSIQSPETLKKLNTILLKLKDKRFIDLTFSLFQNIDKLKWLIILYNNFIFFTCRKQGEIWHIFHVKLCRFAGISNFNLFF